MRQPSQRILLLALLLLGGLVAIPLWRMGNPSGTTSKSKNHDPSPAVLAEDTSKKHIYLLIGGTNMAGTAELPENAASPIERCSLLNEQKQWEPASGVFNRYSSIDPAATSRKLGPGRSFATALIANHPALEIGLVVNAGEDAPINEWLGKSKLYWGIRSRTKVLLQDNLLKGVLWMPSAKDVAEPADYHKKLAQLIGSLRSDLLEPNLPFVTVEVPGADALNAELGKLAEISDFTRVVSADGLTTSSDGFHFDTTAQLTLGERFADSMTRLRATLPPPLTPPTDLQPIDPHVHAMSVTPLGLRSVAKWMEERNVERCIVSPLNHKGSRPQNEEEYQTLLAHFQPYRGRIDRMCIIDAGEVDTVEAAVRILEREKSDGAIAFGEHYGRDLMFDDPKNLLLYEACEKVGLPVMFHIDQNKNMVTPGMPEVDRVLKKFPSCDLVAHAYWWRQLASGTCDRQLQEHPNLYADMSGHVVVQLLNQDRKYAREFLIRNQDKILWATDEGWWSFGDRSRQMNLHYTVLEGLDLPDEVRRKIYRENALKVYRLSTP